MHFCILFLFFYFFSICSPFRVILVTLFLLGNVRISGGSIIGFIAGIEFIFVCVINFLLSLQVRLVTELPFAVSFGTF